MGRADVLTVTSLLFAKSVPKTTCTLMHGQGWQVICCHGQWFLISKVPWQARKKRPQWKVTSFALGHIWMELPETSLFSEYMPVGTRRNKGTTPHAESDKDTKYKFPPSYLVFWHPGCQRPNLSLGIISRHNLSATMLLVTHSQLFAEHIPFNARWLLLLHSVTHSIQLI